MRRRSFPWWFQAFLLIGTIEATAIGASGWLAPLGSLFPTLLPPKVSPLNGRVIGAFYLAGAAGLLSSYLTRRASDARIYTYGFGFIAGSLLIATFVYWDEFTVDHTPWGWLVSYIVDPIVAVIAIVRLGLMRPAAPGRHALTAPLLVVAAILGGMGLVMLTAPGFAADLWPWGLPVLLSRVYACLLLGFALGAALAAWEGRPAAVRPFAVSLVALTALALLGSARHLDRFKHGRHEWAWFGAVGCLAVLAVGMTHSLVRFRAASSDEIIIDLPATVGH